ncbi:MAG TPA: PP2C family protein-serine/threonine phosphatase [Spirochaetota bacterium]|nr:PP2C family protein-serine/threonine phosphatase [Spirochaetota bacterium]HOM38513.1 PP2C family protein-serine/threonine phosphatase [Spirochaetota bacterium]HPQ49053.1 PP2C family protein-serine/threonine phosphatase [Spirochaetota bacterium]
MLKNKIDNNKLVLDKNLKNEIDKIFENENEKNLIKSNTTLDKIKGEVISKIVTSLYYVYEDVYIGDLLEELLKKEDISVICVVNKDKKPIGIIIRQIIFDMAGKKFGRDLLENKKIEDLSNKPYLDIVKKTQCFYANTPIFTIVNEIGTLEEKTIKYFITITNEGDFYGIFSNIDLLSYISNMTQKEMKLAKEIQLSIIKEENYIEDKNIKIAGATSMAKGLGGDFYIIKKIDEKYIVSLCDVSGKGISSALVSVLLGGFFSVYDFSKGLTNFIKSLNNYIFDSFNLQKYLTGIFLKINKESRKTVIYDMGHSYLYIYRNKKIHKIKNPNVNLPIGISKDIEVNVASIHLKNNDILLVLSDGIIEQEDFNGNMYPIERIENIISKNEEEIDKIPVLILKDIEKFRGKEPQHDDATIIVLKYKE